MCIWYSEPAKLQPESTGVQLGNWEGLSVGPEDGKHRSRWSKLLPGVKISKSKVTLDVSKTCRRALVYKNAFAAGRFGPSSFNF